MNATLTYAHFLWKPGTRVQVNSYWASEAHVSVTLPPVGDLEHSQTWVLPVDCVELDKGVKLEVKGSTPDVCRTTK